MPSQTTVEAPDETVHTHNNPVPLHGGFIEKPVDHATMRALCPVPDVQAIVYFGNLIGLNWAAVYMKACKEHGRSLDSIPHRWTPHDVVLEVFAQSPGNKESRSCS